MRSVWIFGMLAVGLAATSAVSIAHGNVDSIMSPRGQMDGGIAAEDVACREGLQLMLRAEGGALCVTEQNAERLEELLVAKAADARAGAAEYDLMREAVIATDNAVALYDEHGTDSFELINELNAGEPPYVFVTPVSIARIAGGSVIDGWSTDRWIEINLEAAVGSIRDMLEDGTGVWTTYMSLNPATGIDQAKISWLVQSGGLLFGSGFYLEGTRATEIGADWSVRKSIATYDYDWSGGDATLAWITAMESTQEIYPFVLDTDGIVLAHGADPELVGEESLFVTEQTWPGMITELEENGTMTARYEFDNPATGTVEPKQSVLVLHDGHVFGSGFYNPDDAISSVGKSMVATSRPIVTNYEFGTGDMMAGEGMAADKTETGDATADDEMTQAHPESDATALTDAEAAWLAENGPISVAYDPHWRPLEYADDDGNIAGLAAWYITKIEEFAEASIEPVGGIATWADALEAGMDDRADLFLMIMDTADRRDFLRFTSPHMTLDAHMITAGMQDVDSADLAGVRIAMVDGYAIESWLDARHPDAEYVTRGTVGDALQAVADGDADVYIGVPAIVSHVISTNGIDGLADAGPSGYAYELSAAVQKDNDMLFSIIQKSLDSISDDEKAAALESLAGTGLASMLTV